MNFLFIIILMLLPSLAMAAPPNAGQILEEQKQNQQQLPASASVAYSQPSPSVRVSQGPRVRVNGFRFVGDVHVLNKHALRKVVRGYIGQELTFGQLEQAAYAVSQYLHSLGFTFGRAYLQAQQIKDGIVEITVLLGRVTQDDIIVNEATRLRISQDTLHKTLAYAIVDQDSSFLKMQNIQRGLLLVNSLPGVSARAELEPGSSPDTSRVVTNVTEGPFVTGNVSTDNFGDRYTGTQRFNSEVDINDPFHHGDEISIQTTAAEHLAIEKALYSIPIGYNGLRLSTSYTDLIYSIGKEFAALNAHGLAETADVTASYPFILT